MAGTGVHLAGRAPCTVCRQRLGPHSPCLGASDSAIPDILANPLIDTVDEDPTVNLPRYL